MKNIYHKDIMNLLIREGREGMRLKVIARRVYNMHANLFDRSLDYDDLHRQIGVYLWKQCRRHGTPFQRVGYGRYALKPDVAVQLDLFWDAPEYRRVEHEKPKALTNHVQLMFDF